MAIRTPILITRDMSCDHLYWFDSILILILCNLVKVDVLVQTVVVLNYIVDKGFESADLVDIEHTSHLCLIHVTIRLRHEQVVPQSL